MLGNRAVDVGGIFFIIIWEQTVTAQMTCNHKLIWGSSGKVAATEVYIYFKKKKS